MKRDRSVERLRRRTRPKQAGFSLIELTIALVVTLIVSGAVFGLMVGGKSAFRKEPELSDRQQQIRIAMSLIERDVVMAGQDMGAWFQVFSQGLNNVGSGPLAGFPAAGTPLATVITPAQGGPNVDALEMRGNDGLCPSLSICSGSNGIAGTEFRTIDTIPGCMNLPGLMVVTNRTTGAADVFWGCLAGGARNSSCQSGGSGSGENGHVNVTPGSAPNGCNPNNPSQSCNQQSGPRLTAVCPTSADCDVSTIQVVRYEIRVDAEGVPNLWRSPTGGMAQGASGACAPAGGAGLGDWQLVARGIEDMQVQYRMGQDPLPGAGPWAEEPVVIFPPANQAAPTAAEWNQIVREVKVTLSARALAPLLSGQMNSAQGAAVRGQVTRTITPRPAMAQLEKGGQRR